MGAEAGTPIITPYSEEWIERSITERRIKPTTGRKYGSIVRVHVQDTELGKLRLGQARRAHFDAHFRRMEDFGCTPRVRMHTHDLLNTVFVAAVEDGLIEKNPVPRLRGVNRDADPLWREEAVWERDDLAALMGSPEISTLHRSINTLLYTCMLRVSELSGITPASIEWKRKPLPSVRISETFDTCEQRMYPRTKSGITRVMPLVPRAQEAIDVLMTHVWPRVAGRGCASHESIVPVFSHRKGLSVLRNDSAWHMLERDCAKLEIRRRGTHTFRATGISALVAAYVPWPIVEAMTHATPDASGVSIEAAPKGRAIKGYIRPRYADFCEAMGMLPVPQYRSLLQLSLPLMRII